VHEGVPGWVATPMVAVLLLGVIGTFLTSYTRARAESLGIDAKVGMLQRPERVTLLSAPQAFFGLALNGWVLIGICVLLSVTAWITAIQRIVYVYRVTKDIPDGVATATPASTPVIPAPVEPVAPSLSR
jgi:CDP-diacylglycerol--glycerol-3-phosphate 3-phosphatidyltransferase